MKKVFLLALGYALLTACNAQQSTTHTNAKATEFADAKYTAIGKGALESMHRGDMDKWLSIYADNAKYFWNGGDSLIGKAAISDYWRKRRTDVIDSISFTSDIWLPVKVNVPQQTVQTKGVWLLGWYLIKAKYKTGKWMVQWSHVDFHFDANDKVDQVVQYIDRVPINAAATK